MALDEEYNQNSAAYNHLQELSDSDYEIRDGEPDIQGWDVRNQQGQKIGDVHEMLFDAEAQKVRYIIVDTEDNDLGLDDQKKILVPIGIAQIHTNNADNPYAYGTAPMSGFDEPSIGANSGVPTVIDNESPADAALDNYGGRAAGATYHEDVVIIPVSIGQLQDLPAYEKGNVHPEVETGTRQVYTGSTLEDDLDFDRNQFYNHDHFNTGSYHRSGNDPEVTSLGREPLNPDPEKGL
jgi:hypothetical protein